MASQNKRSKVWDTFEMESNDKVKCRICSLELAFHNSTSAMTQHLTRKHPWALSDASRFACTFVTKLLASVEDVAS